MTVYGIKEIVTIKGRSNERLSCVCVCMYVCMYACMRERGER